MRGQHLPLTFLDSVDPTFIVIRGFLLRFVNIKKHIII